MHFQSLGLKKFRNYQDVGFEPGAGLNIFLGKNGEGKTNLLEAIYFLLRGESFRPGKLTSLLQKNLTGIETTARVFGDVVSGPHNLKNSVRLTIDGSKKKMFIDQKSSGRGTLLKKFPIVLFSPESLAAIKEGPQARRDLLDDFLITHKPESARLLTDFKKALKSKNRLLRDYKKGLITEKETDDILSSLEPQFLQNAVRLTDARIQAAKVVEPLLKSALQNILGSDKVQVRYIISEQEASSWSAEDIKDALQNRMRDLRTSELNSGTCLVGPHKHDVVFTFSDEDARYYCSQGQQRSIILSFKMAQIMYHYSVHQEQPILLLDDVLSELDEDRRSNLVRFLRDIRSQIFLTTTDLSFSRELGQADMSVFEINEGCLHKSFNS